VRALVLSPAASPRRLFAAACKGGVWLWDLGGDTAGARYRAGVAVAMPPAYEAVATLAANGHGRSWLVVADGLRPGERRQIWVRQLDADSEAWQPSRCLRTACRGTQPRCWRPATAQTVPR